jgi:HK97 family phage major capsid protein
MSTLLKSERFKAEALSALGNAKAIAAKAEAENREMTTDEKSAFNLHFNEASNLNEQAKAARADESILADAKNLADELGLVTAGADVLAQLGDPVRSNPDRKTLGEQFVASKEFKNLIDSYRQSDGSVRIPEKSRVQSDPMGFKTLIGQKALFVGGSQTSAGAFVTPDRTDIFETLGRRELTLRDLVSVRRTTSDTVEYVTQTSHTNAAAPVAEATSSASPTTGAASGAALTLDPNGGYKPEGAWAFAENSTTVKTIAEWVPATKRALADVAQLEGLINDELVADLRETEETQMLAGSGTGQNLLGILNTSGIQTQAATTTTDATWFASFRQAITKARTVGRVAPTGIVVNPAQAEKIDTAKDAQNRFYGSGPFGLAPRTLWGVPVVESEAITAGTALVGDFTKAVLWDREQASITMTDSHADFFIRNLVAILAEERVAFAVTRPTAFVTVTGL